MAIIQAIDSIVKSLLPIATTALAAATTTALTEAYAGDDQAQHMAMPLVIATAAVGALTLIWDNISEYITTKVQYGMRTKIEDAMISKLGSLPFHLYDDKRTIDMYERADRFSNNLVYIFSTVGSMISSVVSVIVSVIALGAVSWWLALVVFVATIPGAVIQLRLARREARHWNDNTTTRRRRYRIAWTLSDARQLAEVRVYGLLKSLIAEHATLRDKDDKERMIMNLKSNWLQFGADLLTAAVELGALIWIVQQIISRAQPVGQFVYVQQLVGRAFGAASSLAIQLGRTNEDLANMVDYYAFLELESQDDDIGTALTEPVKKIEVRHVSFRYPGTEVLVLDDISLTIHSGQHIAIAGENGAGKSTLIKLILGLYRPTSGEILLDGIPLGEYNLSSWHRQLALMWQSFANYEFTTIAESIALGDITKSSGSKGITEAMESAEFDDVVAKLPHGTKTYTNRWMAPDDDPTLGIELSGGQKQRLALARNFYRDAPLVVLDEPTSAIDALAESRIFGRLFKRDDKTIIIVIHRLSVVQKAEVVYMLKDGNIVERGSPAELIAAKGEFRHMFESQL